MNREPVILVVDDESLARQRIIRLLSQDERRFQILEAANGIEALEILDRQAIDIIFLDIEMPGMTGFEVLYHLSERPFKIVFQTAYDNFAVKAFEHNACDYILKPFTPDRFAAALQKAFEQLEVEQKLRNLEGHLTSKQKYLEHLAIRDNSSYRLIDLNEVECFISQDHYTCIYVNHKEHLTKLSLDHLTERLCPEKFLRIHRNGIVRLAAMKQMAGNEVETIGGRKIEVSRRNKKIVQDWFRNLNS